MFVLKPLNNSNSDKAFREQNLAGKFDKFQPHYFCETLPKKSSTPVFGGHPVAKSGRTSVPCFKTCKHSLAKMLAKILAQFRPSKLQPQLFGEIHGNTLCQKHWGKLGYSSAVFLELLGLLNRKTWHISCIYNYSFLLSAPRSFLYTQKIAVQMRFRYGNIPFIQTSAQLSNSFSCTAFHVRLYISWNFAHCRTAFPLPLLAQVVFKRIGGGQCMYSKMICMENRCFQMCLVTCLEVFLRWQKRRNSSCGDV